MNAGNKKISLSLFIATLIGVVMLLATLFVPFAAAKSDYKEHLLEYSESIYAEEIDMTNGEAVNISLFEFGKMYAKTAELGISQETSIACLVVISAFALFAIMTTLFSLLKKPIPTILFSLFSFGAFKLIMWDFEDRGVIPNSNYDWGIAQVVCCIGCIIIAISAICLLVFKIRNKKNNAVSN